MRRRRKGKGIITVFVTLIMVPMVAFTGTMVDVARLKLYSSQAAMAADSYGEVVLSEYDNLLKELYGLFAVSQNEKGIQAIEDLAKYTEYSFIPDGDDSDLKGVMPYKSAEITVSQTPVEGASLSNNNVMMTQVSDFMRFRVFEELMKESNILSALEGFDAMSDDMEAVEKRAEITESSSKALGKIEDYYKILKQINDYPDYLEWITGQYEDYSETLKTIYDSDEYEAYVNYLDNKTAIDAAKKAVEDAEETDAKAKKDAEEAGETFDEDEGAVANLSDETKELAEEYVDVEEYKKSVDTTIGDLDEPRVYNASYKIKFYDIEGKIEGGESFLEEGLRPLTKSLKITLENLKEQVKALKEKLPTCSEDLRKGIEAEIKDLENIVEVADEFEATLNLFDINCNAHNDQSNAWHFDDKIEELDDVKKEILAGTKDEYDWDKTIEFDWYDFQDDKSSFYNYLKELCEGNVDSDVEGDEGAADKQIDRGDDKTKEIKDKLSGDETTDARNITATLAKELENPATTGEVPDMDDCFNGSASLASLGNSAVGKFLLTTYDFGMFSSRVSGIEKPKETSQTTGNTGTGGTANTNAESQTVIQTGNTAESEEYYDESLTKVKMSKDVNYLYGAEIEYLLGGYNESKDNLNYTRNIICGVRMVANFGSTYSITEVNTAINGIADAAASAVAATGVGAPAAPLVRVAVSGALRMAVAAIETYGDWEDLKAREDVILYKTKIDEMSAWPDVQSFMPEAKKTSNSGTSTKVSVKLSYEDYMYIMMLFFVDEDTLLDRTSDLITLNVNQCTLGDGEVLKALDFKMADTVTAVKSTCEVNLDFVIVPENFINMFISGSDTDAIIQKLDNGSYGYSVIRGY